jgi:hypothetical protein
MKTMETTKECLQVAWKSVWKNATGDKSPPCAREKPMADCKIVLANPWSRKKITSKPHAGRGQETIWEMSVI